MLVSVRYESRSEPVAYRATIGDAPAEGRGSTPFMAVADLAERLSDMLAAHKQTADTLRAALWRVAEERKQREEWARAHFRAADSYARTAALAASVTSSVPRGI